MSQEAQEGDVGGIRIFRRIDALIWMLVAAAIIAGGRSHYVMSISTAVISQQLTDIDRRLDLMAVATSGADARENRILNLELRMARFEAMRPGMGAPFDGSFAPHEEQ